MTLSLYEYIMDEFSKASDCNNFLSPVEEEKKEKPNAITFGTRESQSPK